MKLPATPAVIGEGKPATVKRLAAAGLTVMPVCVPAPLGITVSLTVMDWLPAVFRVALKVCTPSSAAVKV